MKRTTSILLILILYQFALSANGSKCSLNLQDSLLSIDVLIINEKDYDIVIPTSNWSFAGNFPDSIRTFVPYNYNDNWSNSIIFYSKNEHGQIFSSGMEIESWTNKLILPQFIEIETGDSVQFTINVKLDEDNFKLFKKYLKYLFFEIKISYMATLNLRRYSKILELIEENKPRSIQYQSNLDNFTVNIKRRLKNYYLGDLSNIEISETEALFLNLIVEGYYEFNCRAK